MYNYCLVVRGLGVSIGEHVCSLSYCWSFLFRFSRWLSAYKVGYCWKEERFLWFLFFILNIHIHLFSHMLPIFKTIHSTHQWTTSFHSFTECFAASTTFRLQCVLPVVNFGFSGHEKRLGPSSLTRKPLREATDQMHKSWWQECEYTHRHTHM